MEKAFTRVGVALLIVAVVASMAVAGENVWTSNGPEGGAVAALVIDRTGIINVGTHFAGIFSELQAA